MDKYTIDEIQYKNGYAKGYEDGKRDSANGVVRCKDCEYWKYLHDECGECSHSRFHINKHPDPTMKMDDFCSCGKRRKNNEQT